MSRMFVVQESSPPYSNTLLCICGHRVHCTRFGYVVLKTEFQPKSWPLLYIMKAYKWSNVDFGHISSCGWEMRQEGWAGLGVTGLCSSLLEVSGWRNIKSDVQRPEQVKTDQSSKKQTTTRERTRVEHWECVLHILYFWTLTKCMLLKLFSAHFTAAVFNYC